MRDLGKRHASACFALLKKTVSRQAAKNAKEENEQMTRRSGWRAGTCFNPPAPTLNIKPSWRPWRLGEIIDLLLIWRWDSNRGLRAGP